MASARRSDDAFRGSLAAVVVSRGRECTCVWLLYILCYYSISNARYTNTIYSESSALSERSEIRQFTMRNLVKDRNSMFAHRSYNCAYFDKVQTNGLTDVRIY